MTDTEQELFEERAAIMEFDGGMSREEAERKALRLCSGRAGEMVEKEITNGKENS